MESTQGHSLRNLAYQNPAYSSHPCLVWEASLGSQRRPFSTLWVVSVGLCSQRRPFSTLWVVSVGLCGFPRWLSGKESPANTGSMGLIPGSGRSPGGGKGNPLQCSCLEDSMDRGAWQAAVHRVASTHACTMGPYISVLN